jgi:predicted MPP superfamily phosphohydrolase
MKLYDFGLTIAIAVVVMLSIHQLGSLYSPRYQEEYAKVKEHVKPVTDHAKETYRRAKAKVKDFESKYVDPYRTPGDEWYGGNDPFGN